jgi:hypothetical protein
MKGGGAAAPDLDHQQLQLAGRREASLRKAAARWSPSRARGARAGGADGAQDGRQGRLLLLGIVDQDQPVAPFEAKPPQSRRGGRGWGRSATGSGASAKWREPSGAGIKGSRLSGGPAQKAKAASSRIKPLA